MRPGRTGMPRNRDLFSYSRHVHEAIRKAELRRANGAVDAFSDEEWLYDLSDALYCYNYGPCDSCRVYNDKSPNP